MTTSVDIQGMQLAQEDFQAALDQMNSVYSAMTEEQDNLSASWSGMAASSFGQALGAWLDDLYQIRQELVVMTESLSTHTGIYSDANETSQEVVAAFQQGLGGLEGLPTEPMLAARRVQGKLLPGRVAARRVEGRLLPEETVSARRLAEPLLPTQTFLASREEEPLLPTQTFLASRVEAPLLPAQTFLARREEEPLLDDQGVPDEYVSSETQPRFFKSVRELPSLPGEALLPDQPTSRFLESDQPVLPALRVRGLELPVEPPAS
jgi:WXG100 family type VII secretion target